MEISPNNPKPQAAKTDFSTKKDPSAPLKSVINYKINSHEEITQLINHLNDSLPSDSSFRFGIDMDADKHYVALIETHTNHVIQRFSPEEAPALTEGALKPNGMLIDKKV